MPPKRKTHLDLAGTRLYPLIRNGVTYFRWLDPRTNSFRGLGPDKEQAKADAMALNTAIASHMRKAKVSAVIEADPANPKLSAVILKHMELAEQRHKSGKLAASTIKNKTSASEAIRRELGDKPIGEVGVRDVVAFLDGYRDKTGAAKMVRSEFIEIYRTAMQLGHVTINVPNLTRPIERECKRARLSVDQWRAVREAANGLEPWAGLSMDLAMVTGQRLSDIADMEFKPSETATAWVEDGSLWVIQHKRGNKVCIPLTLRLDALGLELGEVVARCRDMVVSRHLLHVRRNNGTSRRGDPVGAHALSTEFAKARKLSGIVWPEGKTPPTFHEQRSLAAREYTAQGNVDVQALLGHRDAATTAIYGDARGSAWVMVKAG